MKKENVRVNLNVSPELGEKINQVAKGTHKTMNAFIHLAMEDYLSR